MKFELDDRVRSLRRFLIETLDSPPWTVRVQRAVVKDEERPAALVEASSPTGPGDLPARVSLPQGDVDEAQTFTLALYPSFRDDAGADLSAAEAARRARQVAQAVADALMFGLVLDDGRRWSWPYRLPLFDFAAVPIAGASRRGPVEPYGWMDVQEAPVNVIPDPLDELRYSVMIELRVSWRRGGALPPDAPIVRDMPGTYDPPPAPVPPLVRDIPGVFDP